MASDGSVQALVVLALAVGIVALTRTGDGDNNDSNSHTGNHNRPHYNYSFRDDGNTVNVYIQNQNACVSPPPMQVPKATRLQGFSGNPYQPASGANFSFVNWGQQ